MRVAVIEGPEPIVSPKDIPGGHHENDPFLTAAIMAAQSQIDGPTGYLGRALGVQTLELVSDDWPSCVPYRPAIEILEVEVGGVRIEGVSVEWDGVLVMPLGLPRGRVRIKWRAGYEKETTGVVPANAKAAIILAANLLRSTSEGDIFVQQEQVNGVGSTSRTVTPYVAETIEKAVGNLLAPLRVYVL